MSTTVTTEMQFYMIHLCRETKTGFTVRLKPVSINRSQFHYFFGFVCLIKTQNRVLNYAFSALTLFVGLQGKTEWWGAGMVICLERGADLHMAQLMPATATHCLLLQ